MAFVYSLWVGPGLRLEAVSDNWSSRNFDEPPLGVPACEMWCDEAWRPVHAKMREVLSTGRPAALRGVLGLFTITPAEWQGSPAVVVEMQAAPGTPPLDRPQRGLLARIR